MTARLSTSQVLVPLVPTANAHAASKKYVDDAIAGIVTGGGGIPANIVNGKGDIVTSTANDTPAILTVGADGYAVVADSTQSVGLRYANLAALYQPLDSDLTAFAAKTAPAGAVVGTTDAQPLGNKTIDNTNSIALKGGSFFLQDATDPTKQVQLVPSTSIPTATTRTITLPNGNVTLVGTSTADALTNKDLTGAGNTFPTFNQSTTGNAATATKLATARAINGVSFDGTAPITINAVDSTAREPAITIGTSAQYWRGDKTMQTLNQDVVPDGTTNKAFTATMSTKLAGIATGATANSTDATLLARANHTGTQLAATISDFSTAADARITAASLVPTTRTVNTKPLSSNVVLTQDDVASGTTNKVYTSTEQTKLAGIASGATANSADATLLARANHTGTQLAATISDFSASADARIAAAVGVSVQAYDSDLTAFAAKTAPSGAVVGTTDAQTLTTKTIDTGFNTVTGLPWCPEAVITSAAVVDGYNDLPGGFSVEPGPNANGVYLDSVWLRVGDLATSNSGGDLICDIYGGTKSTQGTLITSITLTNGSQDVVATLGSAYSLSANAVVRAYLTKGSSTLVKPLHVQLRGRYKG